MDYNIHIKLKYKEEYENEKIFLMQKVGYKSTYVGIKYLDKGSVISGNKKIIVKSDKALGDIMLKIRIMYTYVYVMTEVFVK